MKACQRRQHRYRLAATFITLLSTSISTVANERSLEEALSPAIEHEPFSGVVRAGERAVLSAELDAVVLSMPFREGQEFKQDDVLIALDCTLAEAALGQASARFDVATQDHASNQQLKALDSVSDLELAESTTRLAEASHEVIAASHRQNRCRVLAPFDGVVLRTDIRKHERVQTGQELLEVASTDAHTVEFLVPSSQASHLRIGQTFSFSIGETGHSHAGKIERIVPDVDPVSRTVKLVGQLNDLSQPELAAANPISTNIESSLWPGMSGWVRLDE
ncbi:efflux RND transporter periplasmic adaptor subunit [Granulosicoccus antarcticus]|uniref:Multidrug resistance protein MdtA n=1 Tax=Granulosicoccus antarcticus IMCC3135 TaxID=1192854 RepID=A0A2Z2NTI6_9GAMM|nr:efflux RND transporter periplasmic adaptor subunit [Granulosicoccus antarcticus]ASJ73048.1 Multidrug resistance protein MdtA [Granulosicoccus antarcticus IMCC3135]